MTGEDKLPRAWDPCGLDEQDIAADRGPGKAGRHTRYAGAHRHLVLEPLGAEDRGKIACIDAHFVRASFSDLDRRMPKCPADLAFEAAYARFARIVLNDVAQRLVGDFGLLGLEAVRLQLAPDQIAPGDLELLAFGIAGKRYDLHAVAQGSRNGIEDVRSGDERHAAQVERHAEIVVAEGVVLLGVEHFQKCGGWIALYAGPELVDLIEHHHAIA